MYKVEIKINIVVIEKPVREYESPDKIIIFMDFRAGICSFLL